MRVNIVDPLKCEVHQVKSKPITWNFPNTEPPKERLPKPQVKVIKPYELREPGVGLDFFYKKEKIDYTVLEIQPSQYTSNEKVKWLVTEFSRLFQSIFDRIDISLDGLKHIPEMSIWWEVLIYKGQIKFFLVVPDRGFIKDTIKRQVMKTWKKCTVREVKDYMIAFSPQDTDVTKLTLKYHSILSLDTSDPTYTPLESILNAKYYLKDNDIALLQIGMLPQGEGWNTNAREIMEDIKKSGKVPRKKGKKPTIKELTTKGLFGAGITMEEAMNLLGDILIPDWEEDRSFMDLVRGDNGEIDTSSTKNKFRSEAFKVNINLVAKSDDVQRRVAILRALAAGFDPLEGDNMLVEDIIPERNKSVILDHVTNRRMMSRYNGDILCALELAKIINVPDQKAQIEHFNELSLATHRGESDIPKEIFHDDGGIPFATYEDTDGISKMVYFNAGNANLFSMARVVIGEPGSGKTTFAVSYAVDAFIRGYGVFVIDAADGKLVQRILDRIPPNLRNKVKILDLLNTNMPIGLGWNEAFHMRNTDIIEDLIVEEVISYIELVSGTELNMKARIWVENAVKAVFTTPDATLQDVENMINNAEYRDKIIPTIGDPELRADWERFHNDDESERSAIYDQIYRRLAPVMRKKTLKNFILQRPKKDKDGNYLVDIRKWMDEGYLVLVKANETLGETLQTALVSFLMAKFNLAMISREDISSEDDRRPCFLILDEPDHYIKGSERWRNMLTRYRKYRCGLIFMFHGWQQLIEQDRNLPKIIRKSGPHYIVFQTDKDNLIELQDVIEPEFKIGNIAKGMPKQHAVVKLKMYSDSGESTPAFMVKAIDMVETRYKYYNNNDLYELCSSELGRPKDQVMEEIYASRQGAEFSRLPTSTDGEGELVVRKPVNKGKQADNGDARTKKIITYEVNEFLQQQLTNGDDMDEDLILEMDRLLEGDNE